MHGRGAPERRTRCTTSRSRRTAAGDAFDQSRFRGLRPLYGLPLKVWSAKQRSGSRCDRGRCGRSGQAGSPRRPRPRRRRLGRSLDLSPAVLTGRRGGARSRRRARGRRLADGGGRRRLTEALDGSATRSSRERSRSIPPTRTSTRPWSAVSPICSATSARGSMPADRGTTSSRPTSGSTSSPSRRRMSADVRELGRVLVERAREHAADPMPGSTHVRPAQPSRSGTICCAHAWALARDLDGSPTGGAARPSHRSARGRSRRRRSVSTRRRRPSGWAWTERSTTRSTR